MNAGNSNQLIENEADDQNGGYDDNQQLQNAYPHQQYSQSQVQQRQQPQQQYPQHQYRSNSYIGNGANSGHEQYRRYRRELLDADDLQLKNELERRELCKTIDCAVIKCTAKNLIGSQSAAIAFRLRLVSQTANLVGCAKCVWLSRHHC